MKSRFPTPDNIGAAPFQSAFVSKVPVTTMTSDTKEDYPTFSEMVFSNNLFAQVAKSIGLTSSIANTIEQKYFQNVGSKVDDIVIVFLTIALAMPNEVRNKDWAKIASFAKKIQEQGAVVLKDNLPEQTYELALQISQDFEKGEMSQRIKTQISKIMSASKTSTLPQIKSSIRVPQVQATAVPQVQATYIPQVQATTAPQEDVQVADVEDEVSEVTSIPGVPDFGVDLGIPMEQIQSAIQVAQEMPAIVERNSLLTKENEALKKEVEAAKKSASTNKYIAMGLGIALLAGGGYWYYTTQQKQ